MPAQPIRNLKNSKQTKLNPPRKNNPITSRRRRIAKSKFISFSLTPSPARWPRTAGCPGRAPRRRGARRAAGTPATASRGRTGTCICCSPCPTILSPETARGGFPCANPLRDLKNFPVVFVWICAKEREERERQLLQRLCVCESGFSRFGIGALFPRKVKLLSCRVEARFATWRSVIGSGRCPGWTVRIHCGANPVAISVCFCVVSMS